jgi:DNA gyrase/topoisomerase IV subunit A
MSNTTTVSNGRRKIGQQEKSLEMVALESTPLATNETDSILSATEKTFQTETESKSYSVNNRFSKYVSLLVTFFRRILSWLNGFGGGKIDVHRMESGRSEQLGLRKWNL